MGIKAISFWIAMPWLLLLYEIDGEKNLLSVKKRDEIILARDFWESLLTSLTGIHWNDLPQT